MTLTARGSSTGIAERSLIESIAAELRSSQPEGAEPTTMRAAGESGGSTSRIVRGIGDDAAVVRARPICVTSVDAMIEGVHFRLGEGWLTPAQVGRRALAAALSDLAAMGADPGEAYLALGLPAGFGEQQALELVRGAKALAAQHGHHDRRRRRGRAHRRSPSASPSSAGPSPPISWSGATGRSRETWWGSPADWAARAPGWP